MKKIKLILSKVITTILLVTTTFTTFMPQVTNASTTNIASNYIRNGGNPAFSSYRQDILVNHNTKRIDVNNWGGIPATSQIFDKDVNLILNEASRGISSYAYEDGQYYLFDGNPYYNNWLTFEQGDFRDLLWNNGAINASYRVF